jgi:hypothetical protein
MLKFVVLALALALAPVLVGGDSWSRLEQQFAKQGDEASPSSQSPFSLPKYS